jgi:hypothetical protein
MAPEALVMHESSTRSDVWSYGVLMWEVWSLAECRPYAHINNPAALLHRLAYGEHLPQPSGYAHLSLLLGCDTTKLHLKARVRNRSPGQEWAQRTLANILAR